MQQVYNSANNGINPDSKSLKAVISHFAATPEFHITNNLMNSRTSTITERETPDISTPPNPPPVTGYKAIVYLYMDGAMDSYSALVPMNCYLNQQYVSVRGDIAITSGLLPIDASTSNQPCDDFGLHPSLANIHSLYNDGDASFISNVGVSCPFTL